MASTQAAQRKAVVDEIADGVLAERAEAERVRAEREAQAKAERLKQEQMLSMAALDMESYCAAVAKVEAAIDALATAERERAALASKLCQAPGFAHCLAASAWRRRFGEYLSRRLFDLFRDNNLGRIVLNSGGNTMTTSLAISERITLDRVFVSVNGESENE